VPNLMGSCFPNKRGTFPSLALHEVRNVQQSLGGG